MRTQPPTNEEQPTVVTVVNPTPHSRCLYHRTDIDEIFGKNFDHKLREIALNCAWNVVCNPYVTADDLERVLDVLVQLQYDEAEQS